MYVRIAVLAAVSLLLVAACGDDSKPGQSSSSASSSGPHPAAIVRGQCTDIPNAKVADYATGCLDRGTKVIAAHYKCNSGKDLVALTVGDTLYIGPIDGAFAHKSVADAQAAC